MLIPVNTDSLVVAILFVIDNHPVKFTFEKNLVYLNLLLRKAEVYSKSGIRNLILTEEEFELIVDCYDHEC